MSDKTQTRPSPSSAPSTVPRLPVEIIQEAVGKVRFGTVQLIIQDGRIVQIDTTEKHRLA